MQKTTPYLTNILRKYDNDYYSFKEDYRVLLLKKNNTPYVNRALERFVNYYENQKNEEMEDQKQQQKLKKNQKFMNDTQLKLRKNLERKLNELSQNSIGAITDKKPIQSTLNKKDNKFSRNKNNPNNNNNNNNVDHIQKGSEKKTKICKQYFTTQMCRNRHNCKFAHSKEELDVEYQPDSWVKYFKDQSKINQSILQRSKSSQGIRKPLYHIKKAMDPDQFQQKQQIYSIDKVIDKKGSTLLLQSVQQCNAQAVQELLQLGADPTINDWNGCDSIMYAVKKNYFEIMCLLIDLSKAKINYDKQFFTSKMTYLIMASKLGQSDMVISLLAAGSNPNNTDYYRKSAIFYSLEINDIQSIQYLVENGADCSLVDDFNKSPVDYAFEKKHLFIISYLFRKKGAMSDNSKHKNILFFAAENNQMDLIHEIIERGIPAHEIDPQGNNILLLSFKNQHYDTVRDLIQEFNLIQQISQKNDNQDNLVILSVKQGIFDLAKYLINLASVQDLNQSDKDGKTALIYASELGYHTILEQLMQKGVDFTKYDKHSKTALIYAAKNDHLLCVQTLLEKSLEENDFMKENRKYIEQYNMNNNMTIDQEKQKLKEDEEKKNREAKTKDNIHWKDQFEMTARQYAENPSSVRNLISQFMRDLDSLSDSLILEDEKAYFDEGYQKKLQSQYSQQQLENKKLLMSKSNNSNGKRVRHNNFLIRKQ